MAVRLRLKRMGAKRRPFYRIVAADSRSPRDGRFIEVVGTYDPVLKTDNVKLDEEKVIKWLSNGALPTDTVKSILSDAGVWAKFKADAPKKQAKKEKAKPVAKAKVEAEAETEAPAPKKTPAKKTTTAKKPATKKEA